MNATLTNPMLSYPEVPGHKGGETSRAAALSMREEADRMQEQILNLLRAGDATADELAKMACKEKHNLRSRCSELAGEGQIFDSGMRRKNEDSGRAAIVWTVRDWRYRWDNARKTWQRYHKDDQQPQLL